MVQAPLSRVSLGGPIKLSLYMAYIDIKGDKDILLVSNLPLDNGGIDLGPNAKLPEHPAAASS